MNHLFARIADAGLADRVEWLSEDAFSLTYSWVAPSLEQYARSDDLIRAGGVSIANKTDGEIRAFLKGYRDRIGDTVCLVWPVESRGCLLTYDDFCARYDDLWYPSSDDLWIVSTASRSVLLVDHEEVVLLVEEGGE